MDHMPLNQVVVLELNSCMAGVLFKIRPIQAICQNHAKGAVLEEF